MSKWGKHNWRILACIVLAGGTYYIGAHLDFLPELMGHIATALFIAGVIGIIVEAPLRQQLAEDVFSAVSGYPLPDDLREEVKNVLRTRLHCIEFVATYRITHLDDGSVLVTLDVDRVIQNIGGVTEKIEVGAGVEEWFRDGAESSVTKFEYQHEGGKVKSVLGGLERRDAGVEYKNKLKENLGPRKTLRIWTSYKEVRSKNDESVTFLSFATKNPKVIAYVPDDLERKVTFAHAERHQVTPHGHTFEVKATLMAHQTIVLRWWEKSKNERWNPPKPPRTRKSSSAI